MPAKNTISIYKTPTAFIMVELLTGSQYFASSIDELVAKAVIITKRFISENISTMFDFSQNSNFTVNVSEATRYVSLTDKRLLSEAEEIEFREKFKKLVI